jgi:N-acetylmuramoyl-L-alanine amidase
MFKLPFSFYTSKRISFLILAFGLLFLFQPVSGTREGPYRLRKVVIDAGHGGRDPGAVGRRSKEKDIVLDISLKLGSYINQYLPDVEVIYTRTTDEFVELHRRAEIANKNNADLFISIHANASPNRSARGTDTFVLGQSRTRENLEVAMKENAAILLEDNYDEQYQGFDPNSSESYIIFSLMQNTFISQSLNFADHVQSQFRERVGRVDRGIRQAGFMVLFQTTMPSALIEVGFISNEEEERFLMSDQGQTYIASAIFRAFRDYKLSIERKSDALFASTATVTRQDAISTGSRNEIPVNTSGTEVSGTTEEDSGTGMSPEVLFKVQVGSSRNMIPLNSDYFGGLEDIEVYQSDGLYKYVIGAATTLEEIVAFRETLSKIFPDAFIVAVRRGSLVSLSEIINNR